MKKLLLPKSYYLEFAAATLLYIVNVLLTLFFPYFTAHKVSRFPRCSRRTAPAAR